MKIDIVVEKIDPKSLIINTHFLPKLPKLPNRVGSGLSSGPFSPDSSPFLPIVVEK